jgi:hypothetical protein
MYNIGATTFVVSIRILEAAHMDPSLDELHALIRQQASYSMLVAWLQQRQSCSYPEACKQINHTLRQYRLQHQAS